ncbi:MAG: FxsA family protein [Candidatus Riflebacteria bacterium]|nr:FxsA family protein [Candidatus Riflebacteria bacterium]
MVHCPSGGAAAGMALVRRQGLGILQAAQEAAVRLEAARRGEPAAGQEAAAPVDLFGRLSLLLAGLLLLVPGFVTDLMALTLLFPPTRWAVGRAFRLWLRREHAAGRVSIHMSAGNASFSSSRPTDPRDDGVIDTVATPIAPPGSDDPGRRLLE